MTAFWCESAWLSGGVRHGVRIVEIDGVIDSAEVADALEDDIQLPGLVLPGFANAHSHAFHRALRGQTHADGGTFWTWRERMYEVAASLTPESYRALAIAVFAEMVLAGYTVVGEFHYVHHQPDGTPYRDAAMERAVLEAAEAAGIRITLLDALYLSGGIDTPLGEQQLRFGDGSVEAWVERRASLPGSPTALIAAAIHSVRGVDPSLYAQIADATRGLPLHAHVSEQPAEVEASLERWGKTPVQMLEPVLGPDFTAVHATHVTDADIGLLRRGRVCFCPTTERDLADGIGRARDLSGAGAVLVLGSDQNAVIDPFEEIRGLEMNDRLASGERGSFSPNELLYAATFDGYAALGWDGGMIAHGSMCDLVAIDPVSVRTAGASPEQIWLAATAADVTDVVVHGRRLVTDRRHVLGDVAALLADAVERTRA
jgi:formiminoglutamate deiminase